MEGQNPAIAGLLQVLAKGDTPSQARAASRCMKPPVGCGSEIKTRFKDLASVKEYGITALCQNCQDRAFAKWDENHNDAG